MIAALSTDPTLPLPKLSIVMVMLTGLFVFVPKGSRLLFWICNTGPSDDSDVDVSGIF